MPLQTTEVALPSELVQEIDLAVGPEHRSDFLAELARAALRTQRLREFLNDPEPAWKDEDHPELATMGTDAWVASIRQESEERFRTCGND